MCGIVGLIALDGSLPQAEARSIFEKLLQVAESRGREASGAIWLTTSSVFSHKAPQPATKMMKRESWQSVWSKLHENGEVLQALMGHSRLTTHGSELLNDNNQPVPGGGYTLIHNGIVTNAAELWQSIGEQPRTELDTEVLPAYLAHHDEAGLGPNVSRAVAELGEVVEGTVSIAFVHRKLEQAFLYTNHGSLYWAKALGGKALAFASESRFLSATLGINIQAATQVRPMELVAVSIRSGRIQQAVPTADYQRPGGLTDRDEQEIPHDPNEMRLLNNEIGAPHIHMVRGWSEFEIDREAIGRLRRCTVGTLPETMPFIEFDANGVSNFARHYVKYRPKGGAALEELIERHVNEHGRRCLVAFSGGRDSSYALYHMKRSGMEPLAYTYDWGMVTDVARRNQARLCGRLGVEHIIVSADIKAKRRNIRNNVLAWLKRPSLGTVPLFMAGDKQYFYYANMLRKAYDLEWVVLAANPLERTHFKAGFAGLKPGFSDRPAKLDRLKLLSRYAGAFVRNPAYLNSSLLDTAGAFLSYYAIPHDHLRIFDYVRWDEGAIDAELKAKFDWEHATDTKTTWRIGDGTASFYNYIFLHVAGFTENDTLRNNQVLENSVTREKALELIERDNQPRFESIEWYCRTIGLDPIDVLKRIRQIPSLYR